MSRRTKQSGFTLLELLIVLILISLITGMVGPRLIKPLTRRNIESSARQVAALLRYARSESVSTKLPCRAIFDMDADRLTVMFQGVSEDEDPSFPAEDQDEKPPAYKLPSGIGFETGIFLNGDVVSTGSFEMVFFPMGGTSGGRIILADQEARRFAIEVDMITGSVSVKQGEKGGD